MTRSYRSYWYRDEANFGDLLGSALLRAQGWPLEWVEPRDAEIVSTGSVLHLLPPASQAVIVGTGLLHGSRKLNLPKARILALRGPLTAERVTCAGSYVLGDLGLLGVDLAVSPHSPQPNGRLTLLPHHCEQRWNRFDRLSERHPSATLIDPSGEPEAIVSSIAHSRLVVSSSLHGLVLAATFGVPSVWVSPNPDMEGGTFKFDDFFASLAATRVPFDLAGNEDMSALERASWLPSEPLIETLRRGLRDAVARAREHLA